MIKMKNEILSHIEEMRLPKAGRTFEKDHSIDEILDHYAREKEKTARQEIFVWVYDIISQYPRTN